MTFHYQYTLLHLIHQTAYNLKRKVYNLELTNSFLDRYLIHAKLTFPINS